MKRARFKETYEALKSGRIKLKGGINDREAGRVLDDLLSQSPLGSRGFTATEAPRDHFSFSERDTFAEPRAEYQQHGWVPPRYAPFHEYGSRSAPSHPFFSERRASPPPRPPPPSGPLKSPWCSKCRCVVAYVEQLKHPNGDITYTVSCHGEQQSTRVSAAEVPLVNGYGVAFSSRGANQW